MRVCLIYFRVARNMICRKGRGIFFSQLVILIEDKVTGFVCHDFVPQTNCDFEAAQIYVLAVSQEKLIYSVLLGVAERQIS